MRCLSGFKSFENKYKSLVYSKSLLPYVSQETFIYDGVPKHVNANYDNSALSVKAHYKTPKKEYHRQYTSRHPMLDSMSLLQWGRLTQLKVGAKICQDVFFERRLWKMTADIEDKVEISTIAGKRKRWLS